MTKQTRLNQTAEAVGTGLGHLQAKYDAWTKQKNSLSEELHNYVAAAKAMLSGLGHTADAVAKEAEDAKEPMAEVKGTKKRTITAAHKQAISDAAKARWAAKKAVVHVKPVRNVSAEISGRMSRMSK